MKIRQFFEVLRVLRGSVQLAQNGTLFSVSLLGAGGFCTKLYLTYHAGTEIVNKEKKANFYSFSSTGLAF